MKIGDSSARPSAHRCSASSVSWLCGRLVGWDGDLAAEGLELREGARFGLRGLSLAEVVGSGVSVERSVVSMCQAAISMLCSSARMAFIGPLRLVIRRYFAE